MRDEMIDALIQPPRVVYKGGGWDNTSRLKPQGKAEQDRIFAERYRPQPEAPQ